MAGMENIYVSLDIEADGPVPGLNSMWSLGAAAYTLDKVLVDTFSRNLRDLPEAAQEPATMDFWAKNPEARRLARENQADPAIAMPEFNAWVQSLGRGRRKPLAIGFPGVYDFKWVDYYCVRFAGGNPFGFNGCQDLKATAAAHLGIHFRDASLQRFPPHWLNDGLPHTHVAVDDAIEQGAMGINIIRDTLRLPRIQGIARAGG